MTPPVNTGSMPKLSAEMPKVQIYGPEVCPRCKSTMAFLERHSVPHEKVVVEPGSPEQDYVKGRLGYQTAPVVVVTMPDHPTLHWDGERIDMMIALARLCRNVREAKDTSTPVEPGEHPQY